MFTPLTSAAISTLIRVTQAGPEGMRVACLDSRHLAQLQRRALIRFSGSPEGDQRAHAVVRDTTEDVRVACWASYGEPRRVWTALATCGERSVTAAGYTRREAIRDALARLVDVL